MKFELIHLSSAKEKWSDAANQLYSEKISHFIHFEIVHLKPKKAGRDSESHKKDSESLSLINYFKPDDFIILFDETGKKMKSPEFSKTLEKTMNTGKKRVLFVIGGAFGVSDEVKRKAHLSISFSDMVLNHLVAQTVALEQIYRAFTIIKNLPYHND